MRRGKSPAIDALIAKIVAAQGDKKLLPLGRALDRV
jgi:microcin C transport system substrate-binding protein